MTEEHKLKTKALKSEKEAKKKSDPEKQERVKVNQQGSSSNKNGKKADVLCD